MADNDDPKKTRGYKKQSTENESAESDDVGQALGTLSSQLGAFLDEIQTQRDTDNRERQTDRYRQWIITRVELIIAFLTLLVLVLTYRVYNKILTTENTQATIMTTQAGVMRTQASAAITQADISKHAIEAAHFANQLAEVGLAPVITVSTPSVPDANGNSTFYVTNTGHSKASNFIIQFNYAMRGTSAETFDPFSAESDEIAKMKTAMDKELKDLESRVSESRWPELKQQHDKSVESNIQAMKDTLNKETQKQEASVLELGPNLPYAYTIPLGKISNVPVQFFGTYRYDDELGNPHRNQRFCFRYSAQTGVSSCLRLTETKQQNE